MAQRLGPSDVSHRFDTGENSHVARIPPLLIIVLSVSLILAATGLLIVTLEVLLLTLAGVLFGIFLNGPSRWLDRYTPLSYRLSYGTVVLMLVCLSVGGFYYLGSQAVAQATSLQSQLQASQQNLLDRVQKSVPTQSLLPKEAQTEVLVQRALPRLMQGVQWMTWGITSLFVIFFVGLYVAFDPTLYTDGLLKLAP